MDKYIYRDDKNQVVIYTNDKGEKLMVSYEVNSLPKAEQQEVAEGIRKFLGFP